MATLAEIRSAVLDNLARTDAPSSEQANVTRWINQCIREDLCALHYWGSMFTRQTVYLTADVNVYAYPDPTTFKFASQIGIRDTTSDPFIQMTEATLPGLLYDYPRTTTGKPKFWGKRGTGFMAVPTPDVSTYQIEVIGWKYPTDLVSDDDTNDFTNYYSRLVEGLVTVRGWFHYGELEKAQLWRQMSEDWLQKALAVDKERMIPFKMTFLPGDESGTSRLPWGQSDGVSSREYDWV